MKQHIYTARVGDTYIINEQGEKEIVEPVF